MTELRCSKCKLTKSVENFSLNRTRASGYCNYCKPCQKVVWTKWRDRDPEAVKVKNRAGHHKHFYGLRGAEHRQQQFKKQQGQCAICQVALGHLVQDHAHKCCPGRVTCGKCLRGLLCDLCNRKLQVWVEDLLLLVPLDNLEKTDNKWIKQAYSYIRSWSK